MSVVYTTNFIISPSIAFGSALSQGSSQGVSLTAGAIAVQGGETLGVVSLRLDVSENGRLVALTATNKTQKTFNFVCSAVVPVPSGSGPFRLASDSLSMSSLGESSLLITASFSVGPDSTEVGTGRITSESDLDGDGDVDQQDLAILIGQGAEAERIATLLGAWDPGK